MMLAKVFLSTDAFFQADKVPSILSLLRVFIMSGFLVWSIAFPVSIEMIIGCLHFRILTQLCILG